MIDTGVRQEVAQGYVPLIAWNIAIAPRGAVLGDLSYRRLLDLNEGFQSSWVGAQIAYPVAVSIGTDHRDLIERGHRGVGDDVRDLSETSRLEGRVEGTFETRAEEGDPLKPHEIGTHPHGGHRPGG